MHLGSAPHRFTGNFLQLRIGNLRIVDFVFAVPNVLVILNMLWAITALAYAFRAVAKQRPRRVARVEPADEALVGQCMSGCICFGLEATPPLALL